MINKLMKMKKDRKGFTLIELIIVIAIIAILAAIIIPRFSNFQTSAKLKADYADAKTIATTVATLVADGKIAVNTTFPVDSTGNAAGTDIQKATYNTTQSLQKIPTIKSEGDGVTNHFEVVIDSNGTIIVRTEIAAHTQYYPAP